MAGENAPVVPGSARGSPPPAIAIFVHAMDLGGVQTSMLRLAAELTRRGHPVAIISHHVAPAEITTRYRSVTFHALDASSTSAAFRPLRRFLRSWQPDVLISALPHNNLVAIVAARLARRRICVIATEHAPLHDLIRNNGGWRYRMLPPLIRLIYPFADALVGVAAGITQELRDLAGSRVPILTIGNPVVDPDIETLIAEVPAEPWATRTDLPLIVGVGRLASEKDFPTLLRAFAILRRRMPVQLAILGEGPERLRLETLAHELGIAADVHLPGRVRNPFAYIARARLLALSSHFEGFGNVLVEAMACGVTPVSTDCPCGPREVLAGGKFGRLVPMGDVAAFAQALEDTLISPIAPELLKSRAAVYTTATIGDSYVTLFDQVLQSAGGRQPGRASGRPTPPLPASSDGIRSLPPFQPGPSR
jgi:glycosyltransferase involved in cell wall biosynthesis